MFHERDPHEPPPPRNRDQEVPARHGDTLGEREPLTPKPEPARRQPDKALPPSS